MHSIVLFALLAVIHAAPSQVHIALTGNDAERLVMWSTTVNTDTNVKYGLTASNLNTTAVGEAPLHFTDGSYTAYEHFVVLKALAEGSTYYYQVGSTSDGWSKVFNFTVKNSGIWYAVYGDLGMSNDLSVPQLTLEVNNGVYDQILHVGDFAYNLEDNNGQNGDDFMNTIEAFAAYVPYMIAVGNHEAHANFSEYGARWDGITRTTAPNSKSNTNLWYSWNSQDGVHFVVFDTEMYNYSSTPGEIANALQWLQADLEEANQPDIRAKFPWIVGLCHKCSWMDTTVWTNFTTLTYTYGVDILFCGHSHNYQRNFPFYPDTSKGNVYGNATYNGTYTDPEFLIQIVAGSPGNREDISTGLGPSEFRAIHFFEYGYGHLRVYNTTHLYWEWELTATAADQLLDADKLNAENVLDTLWVIQNKHGMRS